MCGIFGVIAGSKNNLSAATLNQMVLKLFEESEIRGKDASGVLTVSNEKIIIFKQPIRSGLLRKTSSFTEILSFAEKNFVDGKAYVVAGHTRMVTNGSEDCEDNNQPVIKGDIVMLHNGIIVNDLDLWKRNPSWQRRYEVDTEVFGDIINSNMKTGESLLYAVKKAFIEAEGANTLAIIHASSEDLLLGSTNGSLYFWSDSNSGLCVFASEEFFLKKALLSINKLLLSTKSKIQQLNGQNLLAVSLKTGLTNIVSGAEKYAQKIITPHDSQREIKILHEDTSYKKNAQQYFNSNYFEVERNMHSNKSLIAGIKRCSKCLLPDTFPFIKFDKQGVCQICLNYKSTRLQGANRLFELAQKFKRTDGRTDCLVPISGGRDSCYGLHYIKKELGLNPVAYTYDWGFVTDLARRNTSRMCGELNIEHILVAADIKRKRENVRKNVSAWLAKPDLGMIPLFMAGDKQFFYYASKIKERMGLGTILFSMNWLEKTGFKAGFAGVNDTSVHEKTYGLSVQNLIKLINYYGSSFINNPKYINTSIADTLFGFASFYLKTKDYHQIFDYLAWDQDEVERTIIGGYGWETAPDTKSTWRIGDGTAAFYNYIYLTIAGFTENDTFRSNQIREGMMSREAGLIAIDEENRPRAEPFKWYCDAIGIDAVSALKVINGVKKLYDV